MTEQEVIRLIMAVRSLTRAIERSLMAETYDGIADSIVENYRALHKKIVEHYPDDYYVNTVLTLNIPAGADDRQKVALVQLAASQLHVYLVSIEEDVSPPFRGRAGRGGPHGPGRDLSDEIMTFTRETVRRALSSIDVEIDTPEPPKPPRPPRHPDEDERP